MGGPHPVSHIYTLHMNWRQTTHEYVVYLTNASLSRFGESMLVCPAIVPVIISSGKTQLTTFRNKSAYPVYITIGNLPSTFEGNRLDSAMYYWPIFQRQSPSTSKTGQLVVEPLPIYSTCVWCSFFDPLNNLVSLESN